jgi:septal ring factor EnvC (AmiA/AmiB activator)
MATFGIAWRFKAIAAYLLLICSIYSVDTVAQEGAEVKLLALKQEVVKQESAIEEIDRQIQNITLELDTLNKQLKKITDEGKKLKQELDGLEDERSGLEESLGLLNAGHKNLSTRSRGRIRALFLSRGGVPPLLLLVGGVQRLFTIERNAAYLKKIRSHDIGTLTALASAMKERKDKLERLKRVIQEQGQVKNKLEKKRGELVAKKTSQDTAAQSLKREKGRREEAVAQLRAQSVRLEAIVVSLTESDRQQEASSVEEPKNEESSPSFFGLFKKEPERFVGKGIQPGTIAQPVQGVRASNFGSSAVAGFEGIIFSKGILFSVAKEQEVDAVAKGQVVFSGEMPGYGKVVILDHGERMHTLYARLDSLSVARGDIVDQADAVGESLPKEDEATPHPFYFEYRLKGKPVNPDLIFNAQMARSLPQVTKEAEVVNTPSQKSTKKKKKSKK